MSKTMLTIALACACSCTHAQHTAYCEMMQFNPAGGTKSLVVFDFGNDGTDEIVDDDGKVIKFNSSMDAIGYMERLGWKVVSAYSVTHIAAESVPVAHYILSKEIGSYGEKMSGIRTKRTKNEGRQKKEMSDDGYLY